MTTDQQASQASAHMQQIPPSWKQLLRDMAQGFFIITHNSFALLGIAAALLGTVLLTQPGVRAQAASHAFAWLQQGQGQLVAMAAPAQAPATEELASADTANDNMRMLGTDPKELPRQQADVTYWLSNKYRVAPEPVGLLVKEAYATGKQESLDPALLLAVMAVESSFNPFAQSHVGAQGLMQVMTHIHADKYGNYGGNLAAFDPVSNLRVGARVLKETIGKAGSLRGGLKYYVGAANLPTDQGYGDKVLGEYARIRAVAQGRKVASDAVLPVPGDVGNRQPVVNLAASSHTGKNTPVLAPAAAQVRPATVHMAAQQPPAQPIEPAPAAPATQTLALAKIPATDGLPAGSPAQQP